MSRSCITPTAASQYTSIDYTQTLDDHGVLASVGSVGDAYDNALAESFVDSFKTELITDRVWQTRTQLELAIVSYIGWFNDQRLHESLGDIPPPSTSCSTSSATRPRPTKFQDDARPMKVGNQPTRSPSNPDRLTGRSSGSELVAGRMSRRAKSRTVDGGMWRRSATSRASSTSSACESRPRARCRARRCLALGGVEPFVGWSPRSKVLVPMPGVWSRVWWRSASWLGKRALRGGLAASVDLEAPGVECRELFDPAGAAPPFGFEAVEFSRVARGEREHSEPQLTAPDAPLGRVVRFEPRPAASGGR